MVAQPWWVLILVAVIAAAPPTWAVWVALKRMDATDAKLTIVHTAVNSNMLAAVEALKEARQEVADLREQLGWLKREAP